MKAYAYGNIQTSYSHHLEPGVKHKIGHVDVVLGKYIIMHMNLFIACHSP